MRKFITFLLVLGFIITVSPMDAKGLEGIKLLSYGPIKGDILFSKRVEMDASGNIYVMDIYGFLSVFSPSGKFIRKFKLTKGIGSYPDFVIDRDENRVYMASYNRVYVYDLYLKRLYEFGKAGKKTGELSSVQSIYFANGKVYISDNSRKKVIVFTKEGQFLFETEVKKEEGDKTPYYNGIAASKDRIFLADPKNNLIHVFDKDGKYLKRLSHEDFSSLWNLALEVDNKGNLYVPDRSANCIFIFSPDGDLIDKIENKGEESLSQPVDIEIGGNGDFVIAEYKKCDIVVLNPDKSFKLSLGRRPDRERQIFVPNDVYVGKASKKVFVLDSRNDRIHIFDLSGSYLGVVNKPGKVSYLNEIREGIGGNFYIRSGSLISIFDKDWNYIKRFGGYGDEEDEFRSLLDIDILSNGNVVAADNNLCRISIFDKDGNFIKSFAKEGSSDGELARYFTDLDIDESDNIYVLDRYNKRIVVFNKEGEFIKNINLESKNYSALSLYKGNIFVFETSKGTIEVLNNDGELIHHFGVSGGTMYNLDSPPLEEGDYRKMDFLFSGYSSSLMDVYGDNLYFGDYGNERVLMIPLSLIFSEKAKPVFEPESLDFGEVEKDEGIFTKTLTIKKEGDGIFAGYIITEYLDWISVDKSELSGDVTTIKVKVDKEKLSLGVSSGFINIITPGGAYRVYVKITIIDTKPPEINLNLPFDLTVRSLPFLLSGYTNEKDAEFLINGEKLEISSEGKFSYLIRNLNKGVNVFTIEAKDKADNVSLFKFVLFYNPGSHITLKLQIGSKTMYINDTPKEIDVPPTIVEGRTLLPIRWVAEPLGAEVGWDGTERKVTVTLNDTTIELWIGKPLARVNGVEKPIDPNNPKVVPMIIKGRTMLPVRFVAENLGCRVEWDGTTRTVTIVYPGD